jgi:nucleoside 2-deoxyribosyltransferase
MEKVINIKTIYLAGSGSRNPQYALYWRGKAKNLLPDFETISPFRDKNIRDMYKGEKEQYQWGEYTPQEIVERDLNDIQKSDLVLAELVYDDYCYFGTASEMVYAKLFRKPFIAFSDKHYIKNHYWIRYHSVKILDTLEDACEYINKYWR